MANVRLLRPEDALSFQKLRLEALAAAPFAFESSAEDDWTLKLDDVQRYLVNKDEKAIFGYLEGERLLGMFGLVRAPARKRRHIANLWGLYVAPEARRKGVARALLDAAIGRAREWPDVKQLHVGVTDAAPASRALFESAGFCFWGKEPKAILLDGRSVDELHYVLVIREWPADFAQFSRQASR